MSPRVSVRVITTISAAILLAGSGFSQGRGGSAGGTTGGTSSGGSAGGVTASPGRTTGTVPSTSTTGVPGTTTQRPPGTIFLTGQVMLEEGGPPPDTVSIERVCAGSTRAEGYTDSKGYFAIELGNEKSVFQDASETASYGSPNALGSGSTRGLGAASNGSPDLRYSNCDLRAKLAGYRSQTVSLANRRPMDDPNIGVILLHREGKEEGSTVSAVSLAAPRDARRAYDKGMQDNKKGKTDDAEKEFQKAVELYPHYATAWHELGRIQISRGQTDAARRSFQLAIQSDLKFVQPYLQLSAIQMESKQWRELADTTAQALKLDPFDFAIAYLYNGVANWNLRNMETAEKSAREAERLDGQHQLPDVSRLMGMILMQQHDYAGAAERMRLFLKLAPTSDDAQKVRAQLSQAEKLIAQNAATASSKQDQ